MDLRLQLQPPLKQVVTNITGSKSETNRLLLLQSLYPEISLQNISGSDDSLVMQKALSSKGNVIDIGHAGTAMRFLTAYFANKEGCEVLLTGSQRMKERPIRILVEALQYLGADIKYTEEEGYPPLKVMGGKLSGGKVKLKADVSSQYITALMQIAPRLENGLEIALEGLVTSQPYIEMTLALLKEAGIEADFTGSIIRISSTWQLEPKTLTIESDWSSASYYYSIIALSGTGSQITLSSFKESSFQGDSALVHIYRQFGVETTFKDNTITLVKSGCPPENISLQLNDTPDIAQTIAVTCFGLGMGCHLTGLHTLKIKETDRLEALKTELEKLGAHIKVTADSLILTARTPDFEVFKGTAIETYNDHRMAMAFAPLAVKMPIIIKDAGVVSKSYPAFWDDLKKLGFIVGEY